MNGLRERTTTKSLVAKRAVCETMVGLTISLVLVVLLLVRNLRDYSQLGFSAGRWLDIASDVLIVITNLVALCIVARMAVFILTRSHRHRTHNYKTQARP
jgi:fumarate reductase subunit C